MLKIKTLLRERATNEQAELVAMLLKRPPRLIDLFHRPLKAVLGTSLSASTMSERCLAQRASRPSALRDGCAGYVLPPVRRTRGGAGSPSRNNVRRTVARETPVARSIVFKL